MNEMMAPSQTEVVDSWLLETRDPGMKLNKNIILYLNETFGADNLESNILLLWFGQVLAAFGVFQIAKRLLGFTSNDPVKNEEVNRKLFGTSVYKENKPEPEQRVEIPPLALEMQEVEKDRHNDM